MPTPSPFAEAAAPPGPRSPAGLQAIRWIARPYALLEACAREHGDVFTLSLAGLGRVVVVSDPISIREVFTAPPGHLEPRAASEVFRPFVGDRSLLLLEGEAHLRERRLLQPALHGQHVRGLTHLVVEAARQATCRWAPGDVVSMLQVARDTSLRVTLEGVLGLRGAERIARATRLVRLLLGSPLTTMAFVPALRVDLGRWSPWGRFQELRAELVSLLTAEIAERRRVGGVGRGDVLAALVAARDAEGRGLSDAELQDELLTLLFAGHDTTSTALAWAWHRMHLAPAVAARVTAEVDGLADPAAAGEAASAPYVDAVCQEALRLHPVVPLVMRGVCAPLEVAGYRIDRGSFVAACVHLAHRRPATFRDPERFAPERFLERSFSPWEYLPFGGGVRRCVGMALALHVMRVAIATIARRARLRPVGPRLDRPVRRAGTLVPDAGCRMVVTELRS